MLLKHETQSLLEELFEQHVADSLEKFKRLYKDEYLVVMDLFDAAVLDRLEHDMYERCRRGEIPYTDCLELFPREFEDLDVPYEFQRALGNPLSSWVKAELKERGLLL